MILKCPTPRALATLAAFDTVKVNILRILAGGLHLKLAIGNRPIAIRELESEAVGGNISAHDACNDYDEINMIAQWHPTLGKRAEKKTAHHFRSCVRRL